MNYDQFIKRINNCYPNEKESKQKDTSKQNSKLKPKEGKAATGSQNIDRQLADTNR